ncbi:hypothetical protein Bpfe_021878, partial [Biomphalaria pfeifferi]
MIFSYLEDDHDVSELAGQFILYSNEWTLAYFKQKKVFFYLWIDHLTIACR